MSKSTIEIKTAFEGCANGCRFYDPDLTALNTASCEHRYLCEYIAERFREQTAANPLDDLFADSMEKLDRLNVGEREECIIKVRCKDCKHKYVTGTTTKYYICDFIDAQFDENGYCHHGERKEVEE